MNRIKYRISLDMFEVTSQTTIKAKKGDTACSIYVTLTENGKIYHIADGCYAVFSAKKPDGNYLFNKETCRIEDNTIIYDFTEQTTPIEGIVECEVVLYKGEDKLTSPLFNLEVGSTIYNGEEIISTPEADALLKLTERAENIVNQYDEGVIVGKDYTDNNFANALKGYASGNIVTLKDVSPVPHNMLVNVKKTALIPVTIMNGECSSYSFSGGASQFTLKTKEQLTPNGAFNFITDQDTMFDITFQKWVLNEGFYLYVSYSDMVLHLSYYRDAELTDLITEETRDVQYENLETKIIRIDFYGATHDVLITQDTFGYIPAANVPVTVCGKNLFDIYAVKNSRTGSITNNGDGTLTIKAYSVSAGQKLKEVCPTLKVGDKVFLRMNTGGENVIYLDCGTQLTAHYYVYTVTQAMLDSAMYFYTKNDDKTTPITISNIMLVRGEVYNYEEEFEPYVEPVTYTTNVDGTVIGAKSIYPSMSITSDTHGTMIEVEYNRDINKAFAELQQAIISMGGNV